MRWQTLILVSVAIGAAVGLAFGVINVAFGVSAPSWLIGAIGGAVIGIVLGRYKAGSSDRS